MLEMLEFLKNPDVNRLSRRSAGSNFRGTLVMFGIYIVSAIILILILGVIDSMIIKKIFNHSILDQLTIDNRRIIKDFGKYSFFFVVLLAPFLEEIIFRLPLRLKKFGIGLSVGLICYRLSVDHILEFASTDIYAYAKLALSIIIVLVITRFLPDSWLTIIRKKYFYFFYLVSLVFALVHLSNFSYYNNTVLFFYPLFIMPQFLMALFIGYVRMEYGFAYGVTLHSLINLPAFLFAMLQ
jgi:hypothetical protein